MATLSPSRGVERASVESSPKGRVALHADDGSLSRSICKLLEEEEFSVIRLKTLAGLQAADTAQPAAIHAIDMALVEITAANSNQITAWIQDLASRKSNAGIAAPIVLLASKERVPEAMRAVDLGAYDFIVTPFSPRQLHMVVRRALEHRRLLLQNSLIRDHLDQLIAARTQILQSAMNQLEQSYDVTLEALGNALDLKDAETEGHSKRVTAYTLALGRAVGLTEAQLRVVGRGAFLHDIGKMAIPDAILRKPGRLTSAERAIMRTHSELGYRMVQKIPYLREAAEIIYTHQECFDGSGYPRGLRGEEIHIGARIFAIADTLDAMTSNRPYRKANSIAAARNEVLRCSGTQFDPAIVDVFMATPDSLWQDLREGILREGPSFSPFSYSFGEIS